MADAVSNFAYSTVATAPSPAASGTSLVVGAGDGAKFPAAPFNLTIWPSGTQPTTANAEIVRCTARSTDTLTIVRAQEGSAARTIVVGDQIAQTPTAATISSLLPFYVTAADRIVNDGTQELSSDLYEVGSGFVTELSGSTSELAIDGSDYVPLGGGTMRGKLTLGSGSAGDRDAIVLQASATGTAAPPGLAGYAPQRIDFGFGTAAIPVVGVGPTMRIVRYENMTIDASGITGPKNQGDNEGNATLELVSIGKSTTQVQTNALFCYVQNDSATADACAINAIGHKNAGTGGRVGNAAYLEGRRSVSTHIALGAEVRCQNNAGVDGVYASGGLADSVGLWLTPAGDIAGRLSAAAIQVGVFNSGQWDVGVGFTKVGGVSSVKTSTFRDDSDSLTSLDIRGTHATAAINVSGTGAIVLGGAAQPTTYMTVQSDADANVGLKVLGHSPGQSVAIFQVLTSAGSSLFFVGASGNVGLADPANIILGTGTGTKIGTSTSQKIGFWNATPVVQPLTTDDVDTVLINTGLKPSGGKTPFSNTYITAMDETINANRQVIIEDFYEVGSGFMTELASTALLTVQNGQTGFGVDASGAFLEIKT